VLCGWGWERGDGGKGGGRIETWRSGEVKGNATASEGWAIQEAEYMLTEGYLSRIENYGNVPVLGVLLRVWSYSLEQATGRRFGGGPLGVRR